MRCDHTDKAIFISNKKDDIKSIYYYPDNGEVVLSTTFPQDKECLDELKYSISNIKSSFNRLAIRVTGNCNMACNYCFTNFHPCHEIITKEVYEKSIDDFLNQIDGNSAGIVITGGEPLLYKDIVFNIIEYVNNACKYKGISCKFLIYTNGTLVDEEYIHFFKKYRITLAISVDGKALKHDKNRPSRDGKSSYKKVLENLLLLHRANIHIEARTVVQPIEDNIIQLINNNLSLGFSSMHLLPVYGHEIQQIKENTEAWIAALKMYEKMLINGARVEIVPFLHLYRKLAYPKYFITSFLPCDAGKGKICIADTGYYYLCSHFVGSNNSKLSRYSDGLPEQEKLNDFIVAHSNSLICNDCWARRLCEKPCYHRYFLGKAPKSLNDCSHWLTILKEVISSYVRIMKANPGVVDFIQDYKTCLPKDIEINVDNYINNQLNEITYSQIK